MPLRVVIFGLGTLGSGVARILAERDAFEIVGAVCRRPENDRRDVGDIAGIGPIGVLASRDQDAVLGDVEADIVVHATRPLLATVEGELAKILEAGLNVVTLTEEAAYPWNSHPEESGRLDALAKSHDVSLLATGVNPGFIWDTLIGIFTLGSRDISEIKVRRRTTLSFLSEQTLREMGVGLPLSEFDAAVARGDVIGHVGTRQSFEMLGVALGWRLQTFEETLAGVADDEIEPDRVRGFRQLARAVFDGGSIDLTLEPLLDHQETYDEIELIGSPDRLLRMAPAAEPMSTAQAVAVNVLPSVIRAEPGLRTMLDLPFPSARLRESAAGAVADVSGASR